MALLDEREVIAEVPQAAGNLGLVPGAIAWAESKAAHHCGRDSFESETYDEYLSAEPGYRILYLKNCPVTVLTSIQEWAQQASPTTLTSDQYVVDLTEGILSRYATSWATGFRQVRVQYTAGYTIATLPGDLKGVLHELVGFRIGFRGNRGNTSVSVDGQSETRETMVDGMPESLAHDLENLYMRPRML